MKKNMSMIIGMIIFVIGAIMVMTNISDIALHPQKLVGTVLFGFVVYRFIKTEYCLKEAE